MEVLVERYQRRKQVSDKTSPKLFYLRQIPKTCGKVDMKTLAAAVQKNCAMTKGDVNHVIEALVEEIQANLANGNKVKLDQLGTFHMTFRCPGVEAADKALRLVNGTTTRTESSANVTFALDKDDDDSKPNGGGDSGNTGGSDSGDSGNGTGDSGHTGGTSDPGNADDNPLG